VEPSLCAAASSAESKRGDVEPSPCACFRATHLALAHAQTADLLMTPSSVDVLPADALAEIPIGKWIKIGLPARSLLTMKMTSPNRTAVSMEIVATRAAPAEARTHAHNGREEQ